jgi:hypothetical protein
MADLLTSGRAVDLILGLLVIEAAVLLTFHHRTGRGLGARQLLGLLLSGGFLLLALRAALTDAGWLWIGAWLTLALVAHLADLAMRWRR